MGSSRAVTGIQPYVTALILVLALAATLPGSDTGLLRVAKASSGSSFEVTVSQAGSGLRVTVLFNGEPLLSLSIYEKALDNTTYDYVINYVVEPPGRRLDPFTVLHYALASGQEKARGSLYLEDGAWATLSMLAKGMTLANVTIKELGVSVTVKTPGEGHESTYVSLLEILREHHLPGWFVKGFRSVWFEAIPSVVRDQWVDVRLRGAMGDLGFIRVTSQGPFNETLKVRILVDTIDSHFASVAEFLLVASCKGCGNASVRLYPGSDAFIPGILQGPEDGLMEVDSLLIVIRAPFIERLVNITQIVGPIKVLPVKARLERMRVIDYSVESAGDGWVRAVVRVEERLDSKDLRVSFNASTGAEPVMLIGSLSVNGQESEIIVYMLFPRGPVAGTLNVEARKPGAIRVAEIPVGPLDPGAGKYSVRSINASATIIPSQGSYADWPVEPLEASGLRLKGRSDLWLVIVHLGVTMSSSDVLAVSLTMEARAANSLESILVIPVVEKSYVSWQPSTGQVFLSNSSNGGDMEIGEGRVEYVLTLSGAFLLSRNPLDDSGATVRVDRLLLVVVNARNLSIANVSATLVSPETSTLHSVGRGGLLGTLYSALSLLITVLVPATFIAAYIAFRARRSE